jgi:hypothetical protein
MLMPKTLPRDAARYFTSGRRQESSQPYASRPGSHRWHNNLLRLFRSEYKRQGWVILLEVLIGTMCWPVGLILSEQVLIPRSIYGNQVIVPTAAYFKIRCVKSLITLVATECGMHYVQTHPIEGRGSGTRLSSTAISLIKNVRHTAILLHHCPPI